VFLSVDNKVQGMFKYLSLYLYRLIPALRRHVVNGNRGLAAVTYRFSITTCNDIRITLHYAFVQNKYCVLFCIDIKLMIFTADDYIHSFSFENIT